MNWNGSKYIDTCLNGVYKQTYKHIETIFIDNNSHDDSLAILKKHKNKINLIKNKNNAGFSSTMNQGINISKGKYILALNLDAILSDNFIENMINAINSSNDIGSCSGKLLIGTPYNSSHIDTAGHIYQLEEGLRIEALEILIVDNMKNKI